MKHPSTAASALALASALACWGPASAAEPTKADHCSAHAASELAKVESHAKQEHYKSWTIQQRRLFEDAAISVRRTLRSKPVGEDLASAYAAAKVRRSDDESMRTLFESAADGAPAGPAGARSRAEAHASRSLWLHVRQADSAIGSYAACMWSKHSKPQPPAGSDAPAKRSYGDASR